MSFAERVESNNTLSEIERVELNNTPNEIWREFKMPGRRGVQRKGRGWGE